MDDTCAWPRCRSTTIDVIWLGAALCAKHYQKIDSMSPKEEIPLSSYPMEEAKRILKIDKKD